MRRICLVTSCRADWTRQQTVYEAIQQHADLEPQLVQCGKWMESGGRDALSVPVDWQINNLFGYDSPYGMARSAAELSRELTNFWQHYPTPDIVIACTDRYETLAVASTAALMNIPVAHIQGGEVTGTIDESIRHAVTKLSHIHFPATEQARERIIKLGERPELIFNVGCPATDLLLRYPIEKSHNADPHLVVLQHPVTTEYRTNYSHMKRLLEACQRTELKMLIYVPNHDADYTAIDEATRKLGLTAFKTTTHEAFAHHMHHAAVMVGNSSAGIREACYFGTPVVNVGTRQNKRERGSNVLDTSYDTEEIYQAIHKQLQHGKYEPEYIYGDGHAGEQIAEVLATIDMPGPQKKITY